MTHWTISSDARAAADALHADATRIRSALGDQAATFRAVEKAKALSRSVRENLDALDRALFGVSEHA